MPCPVPARNRAAARLAAAFLALAVLAPSLSEAQSIGYKRRSANGRDFPTWERDVDPGETVPLPQARQGRHLLELSIPLDEPATGVVRLADGSLLTALADGRVQRYDFEGGQLSEVELGVADPFPPLAAGDHALVAAGELLTAVGPEGIVWQADLGGRPARAPVLLQAGLAVSLEDGRVHLVDPGSGARRWTAAVESASCGPAESGGLLAWGTSDGRLVALAAEDGRELWSENLADAVASIGADRDSLYISAKGATGRSKKSRGPFVARILLKGKRPSVAWRSRVGGVAVTAPLVVDGIVAFACFDGYVHAHETKNGALAWRTDLPARVTEPPELFGGRLDYLLPLTGWAVAIAADNGAVMGYTELPDPDETFIGPSVLAKGYTIVATSFGRLVGLRWEYDPKKGDG